MPSFKDTNGREWLVTLNVAQVKRVRERLGVNLADLQEGNLLTRLADPVLLVDVLFVLVQPQADENSVTDEQFAASLGGDTLSAASTALLEALCDFFPLPTRLMLRKVLAQTQARQADAVTKIETDGDELIRTALDKAMKVQTLQVASPTGD
ncbi:MAG: hypothetical protein DCC68_26745 [Planctomycetota bacterium]|nr:MAG: hypothetical protein DCC68_26745 [Planctomycetota bacterium]